MLPIQIQLFTGTRNLETVSEDSDLEHRPSTQPNTRYQGIYTKYNRTGMRYKYIYLKATCRAHPNAEMGSGEYRNSLMIIEVFDVILQC